MLLLQWRLQEVHGFSTQVNDITEINWRAKKTTSIFSKTSKKSLSMSYLNHFKKNNYSVHQMLYVLSTGLYLMFDVQSIFGNGMGVLISIYFIDTWFILMIFWNYQKENLLTIFALL